MISGIIIIKTVDINHAMYIKMIDFQLSLYIILIIIILTITPNGSNSEAPNHGYFANRNNKRVNMVAITADG